MTARPTIKDEAVRYAAVKELVRPVLAWIDVQDDPPTHASVLKELLAATAIHTSDGYKIAKKLDADFDYEADEELVEILSHFSAHLHAARDTAVREWLKTANITSPCVNDKVTYVGTQYTTVGTVTRLWPADGRASVDWGDGKLILIPWELLRPQE
jgi:hypothetical protein